MALPLPTSRLGQSALSLSGGALSEQPGAGSGWSLAGAAALILFLAEGARRLRRRLLDAEAAAARAQRALAEAERLASVGREASQVAHQLANAVAVVRSNVRWLAEPAPGDDPAERAQAAQETVEAADRIATLAASLRRAAAGATARAPSAPGEGVAASPGAPKP